MKSLTLAALVCAGIMGAAQAAPAIPVNAGLNAQTQPPVIDVAWLSRYGKLCFHGPVWIRACH
jgi:opacity protein-like surface antigen